MFLQQLDRYERTPIAAATRVLLCDFATGDVEHPLHCDVEINWMEVFQGVCQHGLLGLTHYYLQQHQEDYPPFEFRQKIQHLYRLHAIRMTVLYQHIGNVLAQLTQTKIDYLIVKGPAVAHTLYPHPILRGFNDLDIVVRERDGAVIHHVLVALGFKPDRNCPQPPPKLVSQAVVYEAKYWHAGMGLLVEVHYDDLLNAGLASRDFEGFWQRATKIDVNGIPIKVLSLEDQLIHLCTHAHFHGYTKLNWLSDIALIIRDHAHELDWKCLIKTVQIEEAQVAVYYSLYFLKQILNVHVPAEILAALRPDGFRQWWHARYMPEAEVVSLCPMPRPDFSFYFLPLFKRMLPDLLVMGRRREKLRYLLRLWLPPQAWLKYYYHLDDNQLLIFHYLLHPLKLVYQYLDEIRLTIVKRRQRFGIY